LPGAATAPSSLWVLPANLYATRRYYLYAQLQRPSSWPLLPGELAGEKLADQEKSMSFLPQQSMGIRRMAGVAWAPHTHAIGAAEFRNPNLVYGSGNLLAERALPVSGGFATAAVAGLPIYGKYCGPGHSDSTGCSPEDEVDATCCKHDFCYEQNGFSDCGCDCDLVRSMPGAISNTSSPGGRDTGAAAMAFFATSPCIAAHVGPVPVPFPGGPEKCLIF
jgi:hypothetical protein